MVVKSGAVQLAGGDVFSSSSSKPSGLKRASEMERFSDTKERRGEVGNRETPGSVVEIVGNARLTAAVRWTVDTQRSGNSVAWISAREDGFYPPDLEANGVDLKKLPVVKVKEQPETVEAVDLLVRSGFFSLVVVDWNSAWPLEGALQSRFYRLARRHGATLLFLGEEGDAGGIALVPLRIRATRRRRSPGMYTLLLEVVRDKQGVGFSGQEVVVYGPPGLR